ncbi:antitermination regulator [Mycolicibacterium moriokaense]|uniref:PAS and ANTAR domain-containing protein n=1 Tax=Mycolicibacterium moriokaense TaxID=39691 RepID=UPI0009F44C1D|nr:PAS and ANTAR domain-containing protein [Mycolicibacterium moriokaense]MCV7039311.1 PAS and ANTAR domain-containing protein [Mycolicibacterium moriokaense]ORB26851.1 antitermination regulator [Mycolicibacterium moriokaense]
MLLNPRHGAPDVDGRRGRSSTSTDGDSAARGSSGSIDDVNQVDASVGTAEPESIGRFRFYIDGQRWEWSKNVARLHGYEPGSVTPTTELVLSHKHPEDREKVAAVLDKMVHGEPFSSRHRIVDANGRTRWVIVIGERMLGEAGEVIGTSGFYVDYTDSMQTDVSAAVSKVAEARAEIEQAKGLLMAAYGISADRAFDILVWRSQETNIKVRELARRFLAEMAGTFPADTRSQVDHALLNIS